MRKELDPAEFSPIKTTITIKATLSRPERKIDVGPPVLIYIDDDGSFVFDYGFIAEVGEEISMKITVEEIASMHFTARNRKPEQE